jgi:hypothetical protein
MSAANRRRGHNAERAVVKYLRGQGFPDACTTRAKLGHDGATAPGDIDFHPLVTLEVKDVAASCWPSWCRQAAAEARVGLVPAVVRRTRGVPDVGAWECRVEWERWHWVTGVPALEAFDTPLALVDGFPWSVTTFGVFVAAVRALDAAPTEETTR